MNASIHSSIAEECEPMEDMEHLDDEDLYDACFDFVMAMPSKHKDRG